ncbi:MAG TPA: hypothetical protein VJM33_06885 [Microthrixaceae bacterium]|nr:hypothetical protein [Microthrixaceae bacterium]
MASTPADPDTDDPGMQRVLSVMSRLEADDFERFDPPADLWGRISVLVAPARADGLVVEYWIDADDVVFWSGEDWVDFARDNDAPELVDLAPGRTLWSHFDGEEVRELWRALVARVRSQLTAATVPLRCDAPDIRRWFEMTITPGDDGTVRFRSALLYEEPRPAVALLDVQIERDSTAPEISVCSWCGKAHDASRWVGIEELVRGQRLLEETVVPSISQGICPSCRELMSAELLVPTARRDGQR